MGFKRQLAAILAAGLFVAPSAQAGEVTITNLMGKVPTSDEIVDGLITPLGIRIDRAEAAAAPTAAGAPAAVVQAATAAEEDPLAAIALEVRFEFDSARLTPRAKQVLTQVADALKSERLRGFAFRIEGHTDAAGPEGYNRALSERRARAVVAFLQNEHGVRAVKLQIVGKGERDLLNPADPLSGDNRRVQIVNLGRERTAQLDR